MDVREFLTSVLPDEGYLVVATPMFPGMKNSPFKQLVETSVDVILGRCVDLIWECRDVFYALASFDKPRVWNPAKTNKRTGEVGCYEVRTQANVKLLRTLFIDVDIKDDALHYSSQQDAVQALRDLCKAVGLPKPTLVSSGYGLHVYWMLHEPVPLDTWKPVAEKLKSVAIHCGLKNDANIITDAARILRVPGTINFKRGATAPVEIVMVGAPVRLAELDAALDAFIADNTVPVGAPRPRRPAPPSNVAFAGVEGNLGATNDPLNPDLLVFACPAFRKQVMERGATATEPQWYRALGVAKFCEPQLPALLAVSDGYANFTEDEMQAKLLNLTGGPPTCVSIHAEDKASCESCPHWGKIRSPASIGRMVREAAPLQVIVSEREQVVLPPPPDQYQRTPDKHGHTQIVLLSDNPEGGPQIKTTVCPYDFYPQRVLRQTTIDDEVEESSVWVANLPRLGEVEFKMPQALLSDTRKLHSFLLSRGMHLNVNEAKTTQMYMTAYLKQLTRSADREKVYDRLGWHEKHKIFVLPNMIYFRDGTTIKHIPNPAMRAITKEAMHAEGTLDWWKRAIYNFYGGDDKAHNRVFLYASMGAPLFHMTGHKGVLIAASGDTGRGKTTLLEACASVWGDPEPMLISGGQDGTTVNALYSMLGTYHSIPMFWDDTTEREPEEMRKFMINISQGKGKERMHGNAHDGKVVTWETMVLSSANTDDVNRVIASGKDVDPHLMRMISVEFDNVDRSTEMKLLADKFKRQIREHYGHVGPALIRHAVTNYDDTQARVLAEMERVDRSVKMESQERYHSAALASMTVGGEIAYELGLSPFNPRDDWGFMKSHVTRMRVIHSQTSSTCADILDEFLNRHLPNTLILSAKASSNIDNVVHDPKGALYVRNEIDSGKLYAARQAVNDYCTEVKANFRKLEAELAALDIITRNNCHKVLGGDTKYASGQTRCWEIDMEKLRGYTKKGK